jgi:hypothetical protein
MKKSICALILTLSLAPAQGGCGKSRSERNGAAESEPISNRSVGSEARLYLQGRDSVMLAVDEQALDDLINALFARDGSADSLVQSGRVIKVPNNTRVRIAGISSAKLKVVVIEGDHLLKEGWVSERWIR